MRIVLKISGESLKDDYNISEKCLEKIYNDIKNLKEHNELCDKLCNEALGYDANAETDVFRKDKK